ncbi:MAG TPA: hypothetical protein VIQ24_07130 [Pyrinomonadaceae bacterium]
MKSNKFYFGAFVTFLAFCLFFFFFFGFKSARAESKKTVNAYRAATYNLNYGTAPDATKKTADYSAYTEYHTRYDQDTPYVATYNYRGQYADYNVMYKGVYDGYNTSEYNTSEYNTSEDEDTAKEDNQSGDARDDTKYEGDEGYYYYTSAYNTYSVQNTQEEIAS